MSFSMFMYIHDRKRIFYEQPWETKTAWENTMKVWPGSIHLPGTNGFFNLIFLCFINAANADNRYWLDAICILQVILHSARSTHLVVHMCICCPVQGICLPNCSNGAKKLILHCTVRKSNVPGRLLHKQLDWHAQQSN